MQTFTVQINNDTRDEIDEDLNLELIRADFAVIITSANPVLLTIIDDDLEPTISINNASSHK